MRNYVPRWEGISYNRYRELQHFCRQYREWKKEARSLLGLHGQGVNGMPHGTGISDPTARAAEKREHLLKKIAMVEQCLKSISGGVWYAALIQNVCDGKPYAKIRQDIMPTSNRGAFFKARREFFIALDEAQTRTQEE